TAVLDAVDSEAVTEHPQQFLVIVGVDRDRLPVDREVDDRHRNQAPYSLSGNIRGFLPVARAQALAAAAAAAGTPTSPMPPGSAWVLGTMWQLISGAESYIRVHL